MGVTITNCWKMFYYGVKRDNYDNFIGIRELSEQLAMDSFSNPFITDAWYPENKIPPLYEIDN